jgi:hypothetical protein
MSSGKVLVLQISLVVYKQKRHFLPQCIFDVTSHVQERLEVGRRGRLASFMLFHEYDGLFRGRAHDLVHDSICMYVYTCV